MPPFEPALEEDLSDTNLARLLAADARAASQRYAAHGLSALLPKRSSSAPKVKPNTRFLKNLVRDTDSHNAALKRKEDAERRERLGKFDHVDEDRSQHQRRDRREDDNRQKREDGGHTKKRKIDHEYEPEHRSHNDHRGRNNDRHRRKHPRRICSSEESRSSLRSRSRSPDRGKYSHRKHQSRRSRYDSDADHDDNRISNSHRKRRRRRSHPRSPSESGPANKEYRSTTTDNRPTSPEPLEAVVNPHPPSTSPRSRGRLSNTKSSNIDSHFSSRYDPNLDNHPNSDEASDWEMALQGMRDRANFKRIQASRLLAAGFSEEEVKKWETSGKDEKEKTAKDVQWRQRGEEREWDVGKTQIADSDQDSDRDDGKSKNTKHRDKPGRGKEQDGWKKSGGLLRGFKSALRS